MKRKNGKSEIKTGSAGKSGNVNADSIAWHWNGAMPDSHTGKNSRGKRAKAVEQIDLVWDRR